MPDGRILGRGPQCDEIRRHLKWVAFVDAATATAGLELQRHVQRVAGDLEFEEIIRPAAQPQLRVTKQDRWLNTSI